MGKRTAETLWTLGIIGAVVGTLWYIFAPHSEGFEQEDIDKAKASIKTEFEKKEGVTVSDVTLLKKSDTELEGFVKLKLASFNFELTKACHATYFKNDHQYIWRCE